MVSINAVRNMFEAIKNDDLDVVIRLVDEGCNLNEIQDGHSPLTIACLYNRIEIVRYLVSKNADLEQNTRYGTPLFVACSYNKPELFDLLIELGANINCVCSGQTLLDVVTEPIIFDKLIKLGVNVDQRDDKGRTQLHHIAGENEAASLFEMFINAGADINAIDNEGRTPLHYCCKTAKGGWDIDDIRMDVLTEVLKYNPDNTIRDNKGKLARDYLTDEDIIIIYDRYQYINYNLKEPGVE